MTAYFFGLQYIHFFLGQNTNSLTVTISTANVNKVVKYWNQINFYYLHYFYGV